MSSFTANPTIHQYQVQSCDYQRDVAADIRQQDENRKRQTLSTRERKFLNHVIHDRSMKHNPAFDDQLNRLAASKLAAPVGEVGSRRIDHEFSRSLRKQEAISENSNAEWERVQERAATLLRDLELLRNLLEREYSLTGFRLQGSEEQRDVAARIRQEDETMSKQILSKVDRKFASQVVHDP